MKKITALLLTALILSSVSCGSEPIVTPDSPDTDGITSTE